MKTNTPSFEDRESGDSKILFYKVKMIRKGTKPPDWRRAYVPANITFSQMALVLMELLEMPKSNRFEFEFFQKKDRIIEARPEEKIPADYSYTYYEASETFVNEWLDAEKWFTFHLLTGDDFPAYRVEIEAKCTLKTTENDEIRLIDYPMLIQGKQSPEDAWWGSGEYVNSRLKEKYRLQPGEVAYRKLDDLYADIQEHGQGLISVEHPENGNSILSESIMSEMQRLSDKLMDQINYERDLEKLKTDLGYDEAKGNFSVSEEKARELTERFLEEKARQMQEELQHHLGIKKGKYGEKTKSRNPQIQDILKSWTKADLEDFANMYHLKATGRNKAQIALELTRQLLSAYKMKELLLQAEEEELDALENAFQKGCFYPDPEEMEKLEIFEDMCYAAFYSDDACEIPREVQTIYGTLLKNDYRTYHRKVTWLMDCLNVVEELLIVAPVDVVYQMYRRKKEFVDSYDDFLKLLEAIPDDMTDSVRKGDRIVAKNTVKDKQYLDLESIQRPVNYYIPTKEEIEALAKDFYPSNEKAYQDLLDFYLKMHVDPVNGEVLCMQAYQTFSMGGMLSDYMEYVNKANIVFSNEKDFEQFAKLMMDVNNNTRQFILRGHKPVEMMNLMDPPNRSRPTVLMPMNKLSADALEESREKLREMGFDVDTDSTAAKIPELHFPGGLQAEPVISARKIYPNDPCPCGSGKKYKKCCGKNK